MKAVAQARRSTAKSGPPRPAPPRVQLKARAGAANHRRQGRDSFEYQAEEIARRIMRGEKNLARRVTPTTAAGFHATGSNGWPLPRNLREEMEFSFGADFRAVRIHTGAAADSAACEHHANAFASGRDIYFRSGQYAPLTSAGKELLAHELTHVLQQTGRRSSQGIAATPVSGTGALQCDDKDKTAPAETDMTPKTDPAAVAHKAKREAYFEKARTTSATLWGTVSFDTLTAAHEQLTLSTDFPKLADMVAQDLGLASKRSDTTAFPAVGSTLATAFVAKIKRREYHTAFPGLFKPRESGFGLLYDCLKKIGDFPTALEILKEDPSLRTVAMHQVILDLLENEEGWRLISTQIQRTQAIIDYEAVMLRVVRRWCLTPALALDALEIPVPGGKERLEDRFLALAKSLIEVEAAGENEFTLIPYALLYSLDEELRTGFRQKLAVLEITSATEVSPVARRAIAEGIASFGSDLQRREAEYYGFFESRFMQSMGLKIQTAAVQMGALWDVLLAQSAKNIVETPEWKQEPAVVAFNTMLVRTSKPFFALNKDVLPTAMDYQGRCTTWQKELLGFALNSLDVPLGKLVLGHEDGAAANPKVHVLGVLLSSVFALIDFLESYQLKNDQEEEGRGHLDDVRAVHRLEMAKRVRVLAEAAHWEPLAKSAADWAMGKDRKENHVHLLDPWVEDTTAEPWMIGEDIPEVVRGWPVSGTVLQFYFTWIVVQARANALQRLLDTETVTSDPSRKPLRKRASQMIADMALPTRWKVEHFVFSIKPESLTDEAAQKRGLSPDVTLDELPAAVVEDVKPEERKLSAPLPGELLSNHPRSMEAFKSLVVDGTEVAFPLYSIERAIAWLVPASPHLIPLLREVSSLNAMVLDHPKALEVPEEERAAWLAALDDATWTTYLNDLADYSGLPSQALIEEHDILDPRYKEEKERYRVLLFQAAIIERQVVVARGVKKLSDETEKTDEEEIAGRVLGPNEIVNEMLALASELFPAAEEKGDPRYKAAAEIHLMLAMLALAELEYKAAQANKDDRVIVNGLALIARGLAVLDNLDTQVKAAGGTQISDFLAESEKGRVDALLAKRSFVISWRDQLIANRLSRQLSRGFRAWQGTIDYDNAVLNFGADYLQHERGEFAEGITHGARVFAGEEFVIGGHTYKILDVYRPFTYFPSFGPMPGASDKVKHPGYGEPIIVDKFLYSIDEKDVAAAPKITTEVSLMRVEIDGEIIDVTTSKTYVLDHLSGAIGLQSIVRSLEQTGAAMKIFADILMEIVVTFFGGPVGQAAKTVIDIGEVMQSEEFATLMEAMGDDPLGFLAKFWESVTGDILQPDTFIRFLLFPSGGAAEDKAWSLAEKLGAKKPKPAGKLPTNRKGAAAVLGAIGNVGKHFIGAVAHLHERFQGPIGAARGRIVTRPRLASALESVAIYGPLLLALAVKLKESIDASQTKNSGDAAERQGQADQWMSVLENFGLGFFTDDGNKVFSEEIAHIVGTLQHLELPAKIVPLQQLFSIVGDTLLKLLAKKPKGKAIKLAINVSHLDDLFYLGAAKLLEGHEYDPNRIWYENVIKPLGPWFDEMRDAFIDSLYAQLNTLLDFLRTMEPQLKALNITLPTAALGFTGERPNVTPTPATDQDFSGAPYGGPGAAMEPGTPIQAGGSGQPLDPSQRTSAEARFGHDFSHVRVHAGSEGRRASSSAGAKALASGSHIYLHPDAVSQQHVLDHELTHVLQQTGPRPLGRTHDDTPRANRGGNGLMIDRSNEAEAERTARVVAARKGGAPVPIAGRARGVGYAPMLADDLALQIIGLLTEFRDVEKYQQDIDKRGTTKGTKKKASSSETAAALKDVQGTFWPSIMTQANLIASYTSTFSSVFTDIHKHLTSHETAIKAALPFLVDDTFVSPAPWKPKPATGKPGAGAAPAAAPANTFSLKTFAGVLTGYVFARTGVAMAIDVNETTKKADKLKIHYLNLAKVPFDSPLWTNLGGKPADPTELLELKTRIAALDPAGGFWDGNSYGIATGITGYMEKGKWFAKERAAITVPAKAAYASTSTGFLKVATHGALTSDTGKMPNRESHHTTQYLLIEYFRNKKIVKPFPATGTFPGLNRDTSNNPESFKATGKKLVDFSGLDGGDRGEGMPAILLSAETHRQGQLHVTRSKRWDPKSGKEDQNSSVVQSHEVDRQFRQRLPAYLKASDDATVVQSAIAAKGSSTVEGDTHSAIIETYHWMRDLMSGSLKEALPRNELAYYRGLAVRDSKNVKNATTGELVPTFDMKAADFDTAYHTAVSNNDTVMGGQHGWV